MADISQIRVMMMKMRLRAKRSPIKRKRIKKATVWMSIQIITADITGWMITARQSG